MRIQPLRESVSLHEHEKIPDVSAVEKNSLFLLLLHDPLYLPLRVWLVQPIVKPPGWHHVYRWMWHRALGACSQTLAKAHPPPSLGSSSGSSGSRPGAGDISLMLICLHSTQLATSSLSMFLSAALPLSDAEIWFGESREEQKGVEHIDSASTAVSLTLFIPLSSVLLSLQPSPLYLSLSIHFFSFSLQRAIIITPLLDTQAINQGLPSSCAHLPWREQNQ